VWLFFLLSAEFAVFNKVSVVSVDHVGPYRTGPINLLIKG
jgi:hypothetical protein